MATPDYPFEIYVVVAYEKGHRYEPNEGWLSHHSRLDGEEIVEVKALP